MAWQPLGKRDYTSARFGDILDLIAHRFDEVHDELSDCFYNKKPFRALGILTQEQFDKLHALIYTLLEVAFHLKNVELGTRYSFDEYRYVYDSKGRRTDTLALALTRIQTLKTEGFALPDLEVA